MMYQPAPYPEILARLVARTVYRPGWQVTLEVLNRDDDHGRGEAGGLTLVIRTLGYDSYHPERGEHYSVYHYFIVPAATYDERSWRRWLFEQFLKVETHETMEFFALQPDGGPSVALADMERPYAPSHGPGNDPYLIREVGTDLDRRTRFTGKVAP
jgi:hypothetical protein